jgi:hypothetical protein
VLQDREHPSVVVVGRSEAELSKIAAMCWVTALVDRCSDRSIAALDRPCASCVSHLALARCQ